MGIRQVEHFLPSVTQTQTVHAPGPESEEGLPLLQAFAQLVFFRIEKRDDAAHTLLYMVGGHAEHGHTGAYQRQQPAPTGPGHECHGQRRRTNQRRRPEVHLDHDESHDDARGGKGQDKAAPEFRRLFLVARIPRGEKKEYGDFAQFARLKTGETQIDPAPGTIDLHPDRGDKAEDEHDGGRRVNPRPPTRPQTVIEHGGSHQCLSADDQPHQLAFDKKMHVTPAVMGKSPRAEKHDDANGEKTPHGKDQDVARAAAHGPFFSLLWPGP